jgi:two-component SAPR family response regulator
VAQLYTGDYLAHLPVGDWALERRDELRHLYVEVLNALARELLSQGRPIEAHPTLLKAVEIEPTHEGVAESMLKCLSALGRRSEASLYYREYCLKLDAMFGVAPPQHIRELYTQLIS